MKFKLIKEPVFDAVQFTAKMAVECLTSKATGVDSRGSAWSRNGPFGSEVHGSLNPDGSLKNAAASFSSHHPDGYDIALVGYWVIQGADGKLHAMEDEKFRATYKPVKGDKL